MLVNLYILSLDVAANRPMLTSASLKKFISLVNKLP